MKTTSVHFFTVIAAALLSGTSAHAAISYVNQSQSTVQFKFNDTTSVNSSSIPGTTNYITTQVPWSGNPLGLNLIDSVTGDTSGFTINGYGYVGATTVYRINIPDFHLTQSITGSGYATASLEFKIEYQVDAAGFTGPLIAPQFVVNGTVLNSSSLAQLTGHVSYSSLANGVLETLTYGYANNTPGPFSQILTGTPLNNVTSLTFAPNDVFIESGYFELLVDPASITFSSIPEPGTMVIGVAMLGLLACKRHRSIATGDS